MKWENLTNQVEYEPKHTLKRPGDGLGQHITDDEHHRSNAMHSVLRMAQREMGLLEASMMITGIIEEMLGALSKGPVHYPVPSMGYDETTCTECIAVKSLR